MPVVSNSSPLILLARAGILGLLRMYEEVIVPWSVFDEVVVKGIAHGFSDALVVEEAVEEGWIRVVELDEAESLFASKVAEGAREIHRGEAEALSLARSRGVRLIVDDSSARALAGVFGIDARGTLFVLLSGLRKGLLTTSDAKESVSRMVSHGMRIDPKLLARLLSEIDDFDASKK